MVGIVDVPHTVGNGTTTAFELHIFLVEYTLQVYCTGDTGRNAFGEDRSVGRLTIKDSAHSGEPVSEGVCNCSVIDFVG